MSSIKMKHLKFRRSRKSRTANRKMVKAEQLMILFDKGLGIWAKDQEESNESIQEKNHFVTFVDKTLNPMMVHTNQQNTCHGAIFVLL